MSAPAPEITTMPPLPASAVPPPAIPLKSHQVPVYEHLATRPYAASWLGVGGGKTASTLSVLQAVRPVGHILVVAPVAIARSTWIDEIEKWGFPIRTRSLIVDENDRKLTKAKRLQRFQETLTDPPTMYFINQELLTRSPQKNCDSCAGRGGPKGLPCTDCQTGLVDQMPIHEVIDQDGRKRLTRTWPFQTLIIDESQGFKSHSSERFKALKAVRPAISRVIELTGTPTPNGLHDLWSQIYLLDQGEALGRTITEFRNRWFTAKMVPGTNTPAKWIPKPGAKEEIEAAISHLVISAKNVSLQSQLGEPDVVDVHVTLPKALMEDYREFKRELVLDVVKEYKGENGDLTKSVEAVVAENQAVLTSKLMQFASGTLYTADPDDPSTKGDYEVVHTEKAEMAEYLVRNNAGSPVLIPYHFRSDLEQLLARFAKAGIDARAFDGSRTMVAEWNAGKIPVMLLHPASAGHGLNLQDGGHTLIWYTLPFSLEHYQQTIGRLHRTGQKHPVTVYRLMTRGTQDERMPSVLAEKASVQDSLIDAVDAGDRALAALEEEIRDDLNQMWHERV